MWSRKKVAYQIYPRSFKDSNRDGIGDLNGITQKLAYLNDGTENSLGIGAVWISPFYKSPMKDFGYDVSDYCSIDPIFGTMSDFDTLLMEAHKHGIKVMIDFIPNHTSNLHPWFQESASSPANPKRDWYIWKDKKPGGDLPNNWLGYFGGPAWKFDKQTQQYYLHSFLPSQPDLNWRNPEVKKAMFQAIRFWLDKGVDGIRLDAIHHLIKDSSFRDEPQNPVYKEKDGPYRSLLHIYSRGQQETIDIVKLFCDVAREYGDIHVVGEAKLSVEETVDWQNHINYRDYATFNFRLLKLPVTAQAYKEFIDRYDRQVGMEYWPNYFLGNHDEPRVVTRLGEKRARLSAMLLLTLRGTPFIYYGDELGIDNNFVPPDRVQDPYEKRVPGKGLGRDPERTPMPWNSDRYAGFSETVPWLPIHKDYLTKNVEKEQDDKTSFLSLHKKLIHYRNRHESLQTGIYQSVAVTNYSVFAYLRTTSTEQHLVLLNFSSKEQKITLRQEGELICNTYMDRAQENVKLSGFDLRPNEGCLFLLKS